MKNRLKLTKKSSQLEEITTLTLADAQLRPLFIGIEDSHRREDVRGLGGAKIIQNRA